MSHDHSHQHTHGSNKKALAISITIITVYMVVEATGGFLTNSLALISDAGHMLSDAVSLGIGLLAFTLGEKTANFSKTYGYKRLEILAAVFNGGTLLFISIYIFFEAYRRFSEPPEVASTGMLIIAIIGLLVNILVAWILMRGNKEDNLNLKAAFIHVIGDLLGSVGAVAAALCIMLFGWGWADPLASILVSVLVLISGWRITRDAVHILMEGTPQNIEMAEIIRIFEQTDQIEKVHDLHVWSITSGQNALSCHAVVNGDLTITESQKILQQIEHQLNHEGIGHVTIQLESHSSPHEDALLCQIEAPHKH